MINFNDDYLIGLMPEDSFFVVDNDSFDDPIQTLSFNIIKILCSDHSIEIIGNIKIALSYKLLTFNPNDIFWSFDEFAAGKYLFYSLFTKRHLKIKQNLPFEFGYYEELNEVLVIENITIKNPFKGKGIGSAIINYVLSLYGQKRLTILAAYPLNDEGTNYEGLDFNIIEKKLCKFYTKLGFKKLGRHSKPTIFYKN